MEPEQNGQAGTNLAIVILVLVIVVVGVKLLMSSSPAGVPAEEEMAAETATSTAAEGEEAASGMMPMAPEKEMESGEEMAATPATPAAPGAAVGKGMVAFSVSSPKAVNVLGIFVRNPWRKDEESGGWIKIYEGYKAVPAEGAVEVYAVSLAAITYDKVKVRTISEETGETAEAEQDMQIEVVSGEKIGKLIAL